MTYVLIYRISCDIFEPGRLLTKESDNTLLRDLSLETFPDRQDCGCSHSLLGKCFLKTQKCQRGETGVDEKHRIEKKKERPAQEEEDTARPNTIAIDFFFQAFCS